MNVRQFGGALVACAVVFGMASAVWAAPTRADAAPLGAALLGGDQLPVGWEATGGEPTSATRFAWCPADRAGMPAPAARAAATHVGRGGRALLYQEILRFERGDAARAVAMLRLSGRCGWVEDELDGAPMEVTLDAAEAMALGEDAVWRSLEGRWEGAGFRARIAVVRRGDTLAVMTYIMLGDGEGDGDRILLAHLATMMDERLARAVGANGTG